MVELERLRFGYGRGTLFRDLDLALEPGAIYGLLGLNGAGKSTLLRLIAGLLFPTSGRVSVLGHEPARRKPAFLSKLFVLPEELNVPGITDRQYITARAPFYPDFDRPRFERHLEALEVPQGRKLSSLSHGQQKKFLLSFGLATNASLLMLDEPTNGLDIPSKGLFRRLVAEALEDDRIFVVSTHQVRDVEALIDFILVLHEGKVLFHGIVVYLLVLGTLVSVVVESLNLLFFGTRRAFLDPFDPSVWELIPFYIVFQSLYFLGAAWFRRTHFVKTTLAIALALIALTALTAITIRIAFADFPLHVSLHVRNLSHFLAMEPDSYAGTAKAALFALMALLPLACWCIAWLRVSEAQTSDGV